MSKKSTFVFLVPVLLAPLLAFAVQTHRWSDGTTLTVNQEVTLGGTIESSFVRKTADESVTSSVTYQNDDHLVLAVGASQTWEFEAYLVYDAGTTGDLGFSFDVPSGATGWFSATRIQGSAATSVDSGAWSAIDAFGSGSARAAGGAGAGTKLGLHIFGLLVTSATPGNLQFTWTQRVSDGTATTVFTNSYLKANRVS